jgi:hypothetical protein
MVSLSMEQEPMLPTIASEKKSPIDFDNDVNTLTFVARPRNAKVDMFKRLLAAVALMLMGASVLKISQGYTHRHHHGRFDAVSNLEHHEEPFYRGGPPPHHFPGPHGHGPGPHFHHPPPPKPLECIALEDDKAVHLNLTTWGPVQRIFLEQSLDGAKVDIDRAEETKFDLMEKDGDIEELYPHRPPHRGPHRGPPPPPGPPGPHGPPPPGPRPHHRPFGKPTTVQASVKSLSSDLEKKETYVCSLALPCGKKGLGLFHEDITKHDESKAEEKPKEPKEPKEPKPFAPVSVKLTFSKGPFEVSSLTHGPPPFGGPHHHHHQHEHHDHHHSHRLPGPRKGLIRIIHFFKGKKPCNRSAKHTVPM